MTGTNRKGLEKWCGARHTGPWRLQSVIWIGPWVTHDGQGGTRNSIFQVSLLFPCGEGQRDVDGLVRELGHSLWEGCCYWDQGGLNGNKGDQLGPETPGIPICGILNRYDPIDSWV